MDGAAKRLVRASSAMFNLAVTFQLPIDKRFLIELCGRVLFRIPRLECFG